MAESVPFVVLGGGVSGLAAARRLEQLGHSVVVVEACPAPGGLTRSIQIGEYLFDYTGHLLHLARHGSPGELPFAGQDDSDWQRVARRSVCLVNGEFVPAPIQYNLGHLSPDLRAKCLESYRSRPEPGVGPGKNFYDYLVSGFGKVLTDCSLAPLNEKTFGVAVDQLSYGAARRFFPAPDESKILQGLDRSANRVEGYNSTFWYPREGGIGKLVAGLASGVERIECSQEVVSIDVDAHELTTSRGMKVRYEALLTSAPLKRLCGLTADRDLNQWAATLSHSTTAVFNIGLRAELPGVLGEAHWVYVCDRTIPFYRLGVYSNFGASHAPPNHSAIYVETGMAGLSAGEEVDLPRLQNAVLDALQRLQWLRVESIDCVCVNLIPCAYVHLTSQREAVLPSILQKLADHSIHPIGRYGKWDYLSIEDSMLDGIEVASGLVEQAS